jgi:hypothetical protein
MSDFPMPEHGSVSYQRTIDALIERIQALGPVILPLTDAWQLFQVPGFRCDDLQPSMAQADTALGAAKNRLRMEATS